MAQRTPTRDDLESASRSQASLSPRQREVLDLLTEGRTNPEIAQHLGMTLDGAKWHVSQVLWKLGFTSREEAVAFRRWQIARRNRVWPPARLRDPRWSVAEVFVVLILAAFALIKTGAVNNLVSDGDGPSLVEVAPRGESVSRLSVIEIKFAEAPTSDDPNTFVTIEPAIEGTFSWTDERTLVFQPTSPGLLQGQRYRVSVKTRGGTIEETTVTKTFVTAGLVTVEAVTPEDGEAELPTDAEILVQFTGPAVPDAMVGEPVDDLVIIFDPPIAGSGEWMDTSLYRFTPDALAPNTEYTATIADGLTFAPEGLRQEAFTWTFSTFGPAIESLSPAFNTRYASLRQAVTIRFNQPMSRSSVEAGFAMRPSAGASRDKVAGTFLWSEGDSVVIFSPSQDLGLLTSYQVDISRRLAAATGEPKTQSPRTIVFTTIGLAKVAATRPYDGANDADWHGIEIRFTNPMNIESMDGLITVSGFEGKDIRLAWSEEDTIVRLDVELEPATDYTVTIADGGTNVFGLRLPEHDFSFITGELPPAVGE